MLKMIDDMENCMQNKHQSIFDHGVSVMEHLETLIGILRCDRPHDGWKIPQWLVDNKDLILGMLPSWSIMHLYAIYHDCGKPYCMTRDAEGNGHFPNHAEVSYQTWMANTVGHIKEPARTEIGELIRKDMLMHTMKCEDAAEFAKDKHACALIMSALAELHSNSIMFGGIDSVSFKIKWKRFDRLGKAILGHILKNKQCPEERQSTDQL